MLKSLSKKVSMGLICLSILVSSSVPAFANSNKNEDFVSTVNSNGKSITTTITNDGKATSTTVDSSESTDIKAVSATATSTTELTDGASCTQGVVSGGKAIFNLTATDNDIRNLFVSSSVPVKTEIIPDSSVMQNFIHFNSGEFRMFNQIGMHFFAGMQYTVLVTPQSTSAVTVTVSMSKGSALTWVNHNGQMQAPTIMEQNMLSGGQTEWYGLAFQTAGTYRITVSSVSKLTANFSDSDSTYPYQSQVKLVNNDTIVFEDLKISATGQSHSTYALMLEGTDTVGNGGAYTVTIERLY